MPTVHSSQPITVERAQLIDPSSFRFDTSIAKAIGGIGNVLEELEDRKKDMQDKLAVSGANAAMENAERDYQIEIQNAPLEKHASILLKHQNLAKQQINRSKMTIATRNLVNKKVSGWTELTTDRQKLAEVIAIKKDTDISVISDFEKQLTLGNPEDIIEAEIAFDDHFKNDPPAEVARLKKKTEIEGKKELLINQSKLPGNQDAIIEQMQAEKEALGKSGVGKDGFTAKDYEDVIASAVQAQNQAKKVADINDREAKLALYNRIDDITEDIEGPVLPITRQDFNNAYSDPDEADIHWDEWNAGQIVERENEVNFVKKGDPIIVARTEAVIDLNPMSITEQDLYSLATSGVGTENITGMVDRLRKRKAEIFDPKDQYNNQLSTLYNAGYFGDKNKAEVPLRYLDMKRKMNEFIISQKPTQQLADAFFARLIIKDFKGLRSGGWEEKGFKQTYTDIDGKEITQRFRFGDIRTVKVDDKIIEEYYAGTNDKGDALWVPRR